MPAVGIRTSLCRADQGCNEVLLGTRTELVETAAPARMVGWWKGHYCPNRWREVDQPMLVEARLSHLVVPARRRPSMVSEPGEPHRSGPSVAPASAAIRSVAGRRSRSSATQGGTLRNSIEPAPLGLAAAQGNY